MKENNRRGKTGKEIYMIRGWGKESWTRERIYEGRKEERKKLENEGRGKKIS